MSRQQTHRIFAVDVENMIASTLAAVLRSASFDVIPYTQPNLQENS